MGRRVHAQVQNDQLVEERRERIIAAAIEVFREKSFHVATTRDVAVAAKVTQSNLYNYIRRKEDILYLVCERLTGLYAEAVDQAIARHTDAHERLVEAAQAIIKIMMRHKSEVQLLYNEVHVLPKRDQHLIYSIYGRLMDRFQMLLADYQKDTGEPLPIDNRVAANLMVFIPALPALRDWDPMSKISDAQLREQLLRFLLSGLGVPRVRPVAPDAPAGKAGSRRGDKAKIKSR